MTTDRVMTATQGNLVRGKTSAFGQNKALPTEYAIYSSGLNNPMSEQFGSADAPVIARRHTRQLEEYGGTGILIHSRYAPQRSDY
jgi:hypothetical protein